MPRVEKYTHGTPSWVDLATTDLAGSSAFYAGLFGREYVDEEIGEMDIGVHSMPMLDGSAAAKLDKGKQISPVNPSHQGDFGRQDLQMNFCQLVAAVRTL